jgi:hypothetical protein
MPPPLVKIVRSQFSVGLIAREEDVSKLWICYPLGVRKNPSLNF